MDTSDAQLESLNPDELEEFQRVNAETIANLQNNINLLRWKLKQFGPGALPGHDFDQMIRHGGDDAIGEAKENLNQEIEHYTKRLQETTRLTGVTVDAFNRDVKFLGNRCVKQFTLELTVYNRRVRLSCSVDEEYQMSASVPQEGKVTWFQILFQEDIHNAIGEEIKKEAEKIALHAAFSLLKTYLSWKKERDEIVVSLSESNPQTVLLFTSEGGNYCLKISNPKPNRPVFTVEWGKKTVAGRIVPDMQLKVDAPERWTAIDTNHVIDSAPQIFDTMVTTLGLEKALDAFVQLVATDGHSPHGPLSQGNSDIVS